ncbi:MAG: hypothetical protein EDX89_05245 [Acidobacteria bacterium]|nr:MAG: hypothetical protein EDX89_05245 [Acidobacteriota bacterium]MCE7958953.1 hypothetical protein [Acidobacteria bacterium ACB2]
MKTKTTDLMPTLLPQPGRAGLFLCLLLAAGTAAGQTGVVRGGPLPQMFPADNWWNVDVSQAPLDPQSAAFLSFIGTSKGLHPDFGGDSDPFPEIYGMVYVTVPGSQPLEPVAFDYADESDTGAPGRPAGYPIPVQAKTEPKWLEGGYPGNAGADGDKHLLIVDRDNKLLFETWNTRCEPEGSPSCTWRAGSGAVFRLDANDRRPDGWTSADAAGLAILPGLIRYDEANGTEPIRHALRFTVRATNGYVFPASHRAGSTTGAPPLGTRLRLKASKDVSGYPDSVRRVFQAMKTYGLILADNGSDMYVQGTYDTRWDNEVLNPAFASLKVSDFEVVQLGWNPGGGGGGDTCTPDATSLCLVSRFRVSARYRDYAGGEGAGQAVALTSDTGYFWFFSAANVEAVVKVVSFCGSGVDRWGVYANGLTDLDVTLTVTDTKDGTTRTYTNPLGQEFRLIRDPAFACP